MVAILGLALVLATVYTQSAFAVLRVKPVEGNGINPGGSTSGSTQNSQGQNDNSQGNEQGSGGTTEPSRVHH